MTHTYFAFIVHPHSGDVLTHHSKRLPTIVHGENTTDLNRLCANMEELIHGVCRLFLMRTECEILVQQSSIKENAFAEYVTKLLIFEVVSGQLFTTPKDFVWISRMQLSQIVIEPTLSPIVQFIEAYKITGLLVNESRLYPFSRPGWFRNATVCILNVAAKQKLNIDYIEQVSSKAEGCVLRGVNTNGTVVYFKHIGPLADNDEIQASLLLSETMPQYFMRPIDINIEKNWILMHNQGKSLPEDGCSVSRSADLFRRVLLHWGGIQKQSIPLVKTLVDAGMTVTDGAKLQKRLFEIITDAEWCSVLSEVIAEEENSGYLDESRFKDLLMTCTTHLCDQVSEYNVPLTIVHGDLSPVNVTVKSNGQISFIDYGSTCISFPFVDAVNFAVLCAATEDDLSVYFDMWSEYESLERLRQLYRLLRHLSTMVQPSRIFYERYITAEQSKRVSTRADLRTIIRVLLKNISTLVEQNDST